MWSRMGSLAACLASDGTSEGTVRSMLAAAPHRGRQTSTVCVGSACLGVADHPGLFDVDLAVVDGWVAASQGPFDNQTEVAAALVRAGCAMDDNASAAAVALRAFQTWGEKAWGRFRGEFAVIIADGARLWAARDHLGASTLFWRVQRDEVFLATEAKQVVAGAGISREPDLDALQRLFFGRDDAHEEPPSALVGVERVPRASAMLFHTNEPPQARRYWDPSSLAETARLSVEEVQDRLDVLLEQAVARTLTGNDVVALSGGIDSPAIAAYGAPLAKRRDERLKALSAVYPHAPSVDESRFIAPIVEALDLDWHTFVPEYEQLDDLQPWVDRFDGPVPNIDTPAVSEFLLHARNLGARTVLFGELAELTIDLQLHLEGHLLLHGHWITAARLLAGKHGKGIAWKGVLASVLPSLTPPSIATWYTRRRGKARGYLAEWIDPAFVPNIDVRWDLARPARRRWTNLQTYFASGPSNIGVEATSTCAATLGVHFRRPLVDVDLWEFLISLPAHRKYPDPVGKSIIRDVLRGRIPDVVLDRADKTAFNEDAMQRADPEGLRRWILETDFRLPGIRYDIIEELFNGGDLDLSNLNSLRYLAAVHAFVDLFE